MSKLGELIRMRELATLWKIVVVVLDFQSNPPRVTGGGTKFIFYAIMLSG